MKLIEYFSYSIIPIYITTIIIFAYSNKTKVYENFLDGVSEGIKTCIRIFPTILAIIVAISIFRESGAMQIVFKIVKPITNIIGIPEEVLPLRFYEFNFWWGIFRYII